ncbi:outer membrane beta-barrel protein [Helicobacter anatolicus]|uniref:outer membrane beta-barrel protein n=1 Tax=Helicobacter anatolicus TaxID=2905874 RepID=UPI001E37742F|nr:outer membrane beta-barrel protein [Helicobacter anatolicus]MCE3039463.1 hypothetical protein [Helicobacter anatolicus]
MKKYFILLFLCLAGLSAFDGDEKQVERLIIQEEESKNLQSNQEQDLQNTQNNALEIPYQNAYKSGIFLQIGMGSAIHSAKYKELCQGCYTYDVKQINSTIQAGLGYQIFFNPYHGLRIFSTTYYADFKIKEYNNNKPFYIATTNLGLDYIVEFSKSTHPFGIFIGGGYAWNYGKFIASLRRNYPESNQYLKTHGFFAHVGISQTFSYRHRLELEYNFPFYSFYEASNLKAMEKDVFFNIKFRSLGVISLRYIYVFGKKNAH